MFIPPNHFVVCHCCAIVISNSDVSHIDQDQIDRISDFESDHGPLSHKEQRDNEQFDCEACGSRFHDDPAHIYVNKQYFKNS